MTNGEKLKALKDQYIELGKKQAGLESTLTALQKRKDDIIARCRNLGVDPKFLSSVIANKEKEFNRLVADIDNKLNATSVFNPASIDFDDSNHPVDDVSDDLFDYDVQDDHDLNQVLIEQGEESI